MNKLFPFFLLSTLLFTAGCSTDNGRYAVISDRPVSLYSLASSNQTVASNVEGSSSRHSFLLIPTGREPTVDAAIEELLQRYQGDYLANVQVQHKTGQLMFWYSYNAWIVSGDVIRINK